LFRAEEWPIPPDDDSLVIRPLGKEALAAFVLQDGKIEVCLTSLQFYPNAIANFGETSATGKTENTNVEDTNQRMIQKDIGIDTLKLRTVLQVCLHWYRRGLGHLKRLPSAENM